MLVPKFGWINWICLQSGTVIVFNILYNMYVNVFSVNLYLQIYTWCYKIWRFTRKQRPTQKGAIWFLDIFSTYISINSLQTICTCVFIDSWELLLFIVPVIRLNSIYIFLVLYFQGWRYPLTSPTFQPSRSLKNAWKRWIWACSEEKCLAARILGRWVLPWLSEKGWMVGYLNTKPGDGDLQVQCRYRRSVTFFYLCNWLESWKRCFFGR